MTRRRNRSKRRGHPKIVVVIPAYQAAQTIESTLGGFLPLVDAIVVVDDASSDTTSRTVSQLRDPAILLLRLGRNHGVGGATKAGIRVALELGADIVVKADADNQMDPRWLNHLLAPLLENRADAAKGNRWHDEIALLRMPRTRRIGNLLLGFLTRMASGFWHVFDPTNGYIAWRSDLLRRVRLDRVPDRYTFETGMLVEISHCGGVVEDVPIPARYGDEISHLSVSAAPFRFLPYLAGALLRRVWRQYFVLDFNAVSLFLAAGIPLSTFGFLFGVFHWIRSIQSGHPATAGTVILAALPVLIGFGFLLQALVLDIGQSKNRKIASGPLPHPQAARRRSPLSSRSRGRRRPGRSA